MTGIFNNPDGLPVLYHNQSEIGNLECSDLIDILPEVSIHLLFFLADMKGALNI
jgi:hypothetical protein